MSTRNTVLPVSEFSQATVSRSNGADLNPTLEHRGLLSPDQVAAWLGVSKAWVVDHSTRRNPRIPVVRLGNKRGVLRFRPQDIEEFITSHLAAKESV